MFYRLRCQQVIEIIFEPNKFYRSSHTDSLPSKVFKVFAESILRFYTKYLNTNTCCFKTLKYKYNYSKIVFKYS